LNEGEYLDLFFTSDAMIHDSGSFLIEYLYTKKPVMFLRSDNSIEERFNEVGKMALSKIYQGKNKEDLESFVQEVIIGGRDLMANERIHFFNSTVKPPNYKTASENIFNNIEAQIF
jgi:CDP-glycerol glycerophosphotransferase (TagB/SpsB family)